MSVRERNIKLLLESITYTAITETVTCIIATDVVTCIVAIESVSYIVPTEAATCRIDYIQKRSLAEMVLVRDSFSCNKEIEPMSEHQV